MSFHVSTKQALIACRGMAALGLFVLGAKLVIWCIKRD
jgi:hypothetical protein